MTTRTATALGERVAAALGGIEGVVAVALGGSWARGTAHPDSDIDLGIYYHPHRRPSVDALRRLAREIDDRHPANAVSDFGEWGPWINGGAWLEIAGRRVDWLFRDLDLVGQTIVECRAGRPTCVYQIGHPHGFHSHIYMGEIHHCRSLHDPAAALHTLKALTAEYPSALRRALIDTYLFEAPFTLTASHKPTERGDTFYVTGCLFRCVACLVQVLFALNRRYFVNEKGAIAEADSFPLRPAGFAAVVSHVLGQRHTSAAQLRASVEQLEELVEAVRNVCVASGAIAVKGSSR